jgi:uroporphyrinogen decarboxylase
MPLNLEVARRLARLHETVPVRGALSGPFSLALNLLGPEDFFIGLLDRPDYCERVLSFCADTIIAFGKGYLDCGVDTIMFDSQASPELLSPEMYEEIVLPHTRRIMQALFEAGEQVCPLIIGGNTTPMLDAYLQSGTRQILCDFSADWQQFKERCTETQMSVRRNLSPMRIQNGKPDELNEVAHRYLREAEGMNGFILGTAVVPFGTPTENVVAVRNAVLHA